MFHRFVESHQVTALGGYRWLVLKVTTSEDETFPIIWVGEASHSVALCPMYPTIKEISFTNSVDEKKGLEVVYNMCTTSTPPIVEVQFENFNLVRDGVAKLKKKKMKRPYVNYYNNSNI